MTKTPILLILAMLALSGCGGWSNSSLNPGNWFGNSRSVAPAEEAEAVNPLIPQSTGVSLLRRPPPPDRSVPITRITELRVEPTFSGAIIYAQGVAGRQGPYDVSLRDITSAEQAAAGELVLSFRVVYPEDPTYTGTEFSRTVHAAYDVSKQDLQRIRLIRVEGRENARETRRR